MESDYSTCFNIHQVRSVFQVNWLVLDPRDLTPTTEDTLTLQINGILVTYLKNSQDTASLGL